MDETTLDLAGPIEASRHVTESASVDQHLISPSDDYIAPYKYIASGYHIYR